MFYDLLSRLFSRRISLTPSHVAHVAHASEVKYDDFYYLNQLPLQGSCVLKLDSVPLNLRAAFEHKICRFGGLSRVESTLSERNQCFTLLLQFSTADQAAMALATNPIIDVAGQQRTMTLVDAQVDNEPPKKKLKNDSGISENQKCAICSEELHGSFSRPCYKCRDIWCYDCIRKSFSIALTDSDRFPVTCCQRVMHYNVGRQILDLDTYSKYKLRYETCNTPRPIYCANPTCSTFLPPRIAIPDQNHRVDCPVCTQTTCTQCHIVVLDDDHSCTLAQEHAALLQRYGYKQCPRCGEAIARMCGCAHMRCICGAHWCWDCLKPIQLCSENQCREDYGEDSEEEIDSGFDPVPMGQTGHVESIPATPADTASTTAIPARVDESTPAELPDAPPPCATTLVEPSNPDTTPTRLPAGSPDQSGNTLDNVAGPPISRAVNLDDSRWIVWEEEGNDFGAEPTDEPWDTWGCSHSYRAVIGHTVAKEWVAPSTISDTDGDAEYDQGDRLDTRELDCLRCYKSVTINLQPPELHRGDHIPRKDFRPNLLARSAVTRKDRKRLAQQIARNAKLFTCVKCGVFHCLDCKEVVSKAIADMANEEH